MSAIVGLLMMIALTVAIVKWFHGKEDREGESVQSLPDQGEPEMAERKCTIGEETPHVDMEKAQATEQNTNKTEKMEEKKFSTGARDCFLETLKKLGCQYEIDEEDDRIQFAFQGEHFVADATNEGCYVHLWDIFWEQVELYDIDEFTRLRKAINTSNIDCATTTVYSINEAGSSVDVHSKKSILFLPQIPQVENYLRSELSDFFRAHQIVGNEMAKMREKEEPMETKT